MNPVTNTKVLILENDPLVLDKIKQNLKGQAFITQSFGSCEKAIEALKKDFFQIIITGHATDADDPIEVMKAMVMTSPISSIIMVTDLSDADVEEKAEGYGILGNITRDVPKNELRSFINTYHEIQTTLQQS